MLLQFWLKYAKTPPPFKGKKKQLFQKVDPFELCVN